MLIKDAPGKTVGAVLFSTRRRCARPAAHNSMLWLVGSAPPPPCYSALGFCCAAWRHSFWPQLRIESLTRGDAGERIGLTSNDEFGQLARGFDSMASELESSRGQLVEQKVYIEDIVRTVAEGIVVIDGNGRIVSANPAAAEIVGRRNDKIEGQDWPEVLDIRGLSGDRLAQATSPIELALTTGRRHQAEVRLAKPDGSYLPVVASCNPLNRSDGGIVLTLNDISELRSAERAVNDRAEELAALNRELKETSQATTRLASSASASGVRHLPGGVFRRRLGHARLLQRIEWNRSSDQRLAQSGRGNGALGHRAFERWPVCAGGLLGFAARPGACSRPRYADATLQPHHREWRPRLCLHASGGAGGDAWHRASVRT